MSGDLVVADLAKPEEGANDSIGEATPVYSHCGLYIDFWDSNSHTKVPSILEIHKYGVRLVPLAVFLSPKMVFHARVLRHPDLCGRDLSSELSGLLSQMPTIAYDWQGRDPIDDFRKRTPPEYTCSAVCLTLLEILGFKQVYSRISVMPKALRNLEKVKLVGLRDFSSPSSFVHDSGFLTIGAIDNGRFEDNLSRFAVVGHHTVVGSAGHALATLEFHPERLPLSYHNYVLGIIGARTPLLGSLIQKTAGFTPGTFPDSGSPELISFWLTSNELLRESSTQIRSSEIVQSLARQRSPFIASMVAQKPEFVNLVQMHNRNCGILSWYS